MHQSENTKIKLITKINKDEYSWLILLYARVNENQQLNHGKSSSSLYHMALFINLMRLNYITETYISVLLVHSFSADTTTRRWKIQFKIFWDSCEYTEIR